MVYRVLIVDDSSFFQTRLKEIINENPELEVIGIASNGQEAIEKDESLKPDIISMDYEMPFVDGITAVRAILAKRSVPIVMFSSMTYEGARITLEALEAGVVDFVPKNFADVSKNSATLKKKLHDKLITFARNSKPSAPKLSLSPAANKEKSASPAPSSTPSSPSPVSPPRTQAETPAKRSTRSRVVRGSIKLLAIGASTGGPVAVSDIIRNLPGDFPVPIVIVQHMPENFTRAFAERLDRQSSLSVKEAQTGDVLSPGHVFVAPGGKQLMFDKRGNALKIIDGDERVNYKPCVDIAFASAAKVFGKSTLAVVLTGMGADGCEGAKLLKQQGAPIWAQDEQTCVVYGMPAAVAKAGLVDTVLPIGEFASKLRSEI